MDIFKKQIINTILNAIDTDDIQEIALFVESNLSKEESISLQRMLKKFLKDNHFDAWELLPVRHFINFLD